MKKGKTRTNHQHHSGGLGSENRCQNIEHYFGRCRFLQQHDSENPWAREREFYNAGRSSLSGFLSNLRKHSCHHRCRYYLSSSFSPFLLALWGQLQPGGQNQPSCQGRPSANPQRHWTWNFVPRPWPLRIPPTSPSVHPERRHPSGLGFVAMGNRPLQSPLDHW